MNTQLKLVLVMLFWGATFVSGRVLAQSYHPYAIAFMRFLVAVLFLFPILAYRKNENFSLTPLQILKVFVLGMTGVFAYNYFFFGGLKIVEAGKASMIIATNPVITATIAGIFLGEGFSPKKVLGVVIALIGAFTVITDGQPWLIFQLGLDHGELLLFGAVISWVTYTLIGKIILKKLSPLKATAYSCFMGTVCLFPFALQNGLKDMVVALSFSEFMHLFYLGFFATVLGFIWFYQGIKDIGAGKAAVFINLVPLFGVLSGAIWLNERLAPSLLFGGVVVLVGVTLVQRSKTA
jgi:drug/metabolite transporter (DMT)-like permease